jgi:PHD/YefM family antitoxin component YafN of YafNO toxin-antitoxin module
LARWLPGQKEKTRTVQGSGLVERVMGIEPTSSAWKADILADVLYPQLQNALYHNFAQMSSMNLRSATVKVVEAENESTVVRIDFVAQYGYNIIRILLLWIGYTGAGGAFMNIRPSAAIRQNYNEIADLCRETAEPVFLTKNGEGDLVVMDIDTYNRREKMLKLREELLSVEEDRMRGSEGYSIDEVTSMMRSAIKEAAGHGAAK